MPWRRTSSFLAWKIPWTEEPGRLQSMGSQRVGQDWATSLEQKSNRAFSRHNRTHPNCGLLYRPGPGGPESMKRKREKERERAVSLGLRGKPIPVHDLYCSRRHGASSQGGLENPGKKVSLAGFHAPKRMKTERRTRGTQVSSGARVFY